MAASTANSESVREEREMVVGITFLVSVRTSPEHLTLALHSRLRAWGLAPLVRRARVRVRVPLGCSLIAPRAGCACG